MKRMIFYGFLMVLNAVFSLGNRLTGHLGFAAFNFVLMLICLSFFIHYYYKDE